jgi:predicted extracellular nuclease
MGDFNDYPSSLALITLKNTGLLSAMGGVEWFERYTYNYRGISQVLDDILFIPQLSLAPGAVEAVHINADFPYSFMGDINSFHRSSDHDPVVADFIPILASNYLPVVIR